MNLDNLKDKELKEYAYSNIDLGERKYSSSGKKNNLFKKVISLKAYVMANELIPMAVRRDLFVKIMDLLEE